MLHAAAVNVLRACCRPCCRHCCRHPGVHLILLPALPACPCCCRYKSSDNPDDAFRTYYPNGPILLHYAYSALGDVAGRATRFTCPPERMAAAAAANDPQQVAAGC